MARGGSNSPSKLCKHHYNPVIHQRFGESNIQVVILPLSVARQTKQTVISSCYARKREILNGKFLVDEPRNRSRNVSKSTHSSVWGCWHSSSFNTAVFCTPVAYTKRELRAAIGETGDRPMFWKVWKEQCRDLKEDLFPKTVPYFRPNKS